MHKTFVAIVSTAFVGFAYAAAHTGAAPNTAGQAANATGRAAAAAVTPGDQNSGRTPQNRTGGLMGNDRTGTATSAGTTTQTAATRRARADRN